MLLTAFCLYVVLSIFAMNSAYRNGVNDGYGYSKEPWNPGYRNAGAYLRKNAAHRWPEVGYQPASVSGFDVEHPPKVGSGVVHGRPPIPPGDADPGRTMRSREKEETKRVRNARRFLKEKKITRAEYVKILNEIRVSHGERPLTKHEENYV